MRAKPACNFGRRLKILGGLPPYEYICEIRTSEQKRFILNPIHQKPGLRHIKCLVKRGARSIGYFGPMAICFSGCVVVGDNFSAMIILMITF